MDPAGNAKARAKIKSTIVDHAGSDNANKNKISDVKDHDLVCQEAKKKSIKRNAR